MIHRTTKKSEHLMRKEPLLPMKVDISKGYMRKHNKSNWYSWTLRHGHRVVLRTADAYANRINAQINNSMSGYDTVIYRNFS